LLADANALVNEGNDNHASLAARRVLELDPQNADAMRVIARSAERAGLRSAIEFWRRVTELSGNAEGDVTSWARCAIRLAMLQLLFMNLARDAPSSSPRR
jgi:hypothetical protein